MSRELLMFVSLIAMISMVVVVQIYRTKSAKSCFSGLTLGNVGGTLFIGGNFAYFAQQLLDILLFSEIYIMSSIIVGSTLCMWQLIWYAIYRHDDYKRGVL